MTDRAEFSVVATYANDEYEYVISFVTAKEAVETAAQLIKSVAGRHGMIQRVIVTDGGDCTNFAWEFGKGVTYPPEAAGKEPR